MPLDALCLTAVAAELRAAVAGGKIDKLYQPTRDEVVLYVRGQGENVRLLLSANPGHPRANLTTLNRENPEQPPMFCMLLRKHLQGARILELNQPPLERILEFRLETLDELATGWSAAWCWRPWAAAPTSCCWTGRGASSTASAGWTVTLAGVSGSFCPAWFIASRRRPTS